MANQIVPASGSSMKFPGGLQKPPLFGPPISTKIFVGSLAWETTSETLRSYFEQFGEIKEAVVITDKYNGRSKGYGFVTFADAEAAYRACANPNPFIDQRRTNCNLASFGRSAPYQPYGNQRPLVPVMRGPYSVTTPYMGNPMYQLPVPYAYYPGLHFPMYGYTPYGPDNLYPQMYGVPSMTTPKGMLCNQIVNQTSTNIPRTSTAENHVLTNPDVVQHGRPIVGETLHGDDFAVQAIGTTQVNQTDPHRSNTENPSEQLTS